MRYEAVRALRSIEAVAYSDKTRMFTLLKTVAVSAVPATERHHFTHGMVTQLQDVGVFEREEASGK